MKASFYEIFNRHNCDKVIQHHYHRFYPLFLEQHRDEKFTMLEIGILDGGGKSVGAWKEYFPHVDLVGMDIDGGTMLHESAIFKGDQSSLEDLEFIVKSIPPCRVIVDDGSHVPAHQKLSFDYLFEHLLEPGGVYIIEDLECNYWKPDSIVYNYPIGNFSMIEYLKSLVEEVNAEFTTGVNKRLNLLKISSVFFGQNCAIITKQSEEETVSLKRMYRFEKHLKDNTNS